MTFWRRWLALSARNRRLGAEAMAMLILARLAVSLLPFPRLSRWLGPMQPPGGSGAALSDAAAGDVRAIRWALGAAAELLPFACPCLVTALAGMAMLRRRSIPSLLHMGAETGQAGGAETHAWLDAGGLPVSGYPLPPTMVEIGRFV